MGGRWSAAGTSSSSGFFATDARWAELHLERLFPLVATMIRELTLALPPLAFRGGTTAVPPTYLPACLPETGLCIVRRILGKGLGFTIYMYSNTGVVVSELVQSGCWCAFLTVVDRSRCWTCMRGRR